MSLLSERYKKETLPKLKEEFGLTNDFAVPKLIKAVINVGVGRLVTQSSGDTLKKQLESIERDLAIISGQKPAKRPARISIAGFKLRKGVGVGYIATLRGRRMWDFLDRLVFLAIPRMRDFRGIDQRAVDEYGNLNLGIREQLIFPELASDEVHAPFGLQVTVVTNARTKQRGKALFLTLGFPMKKS